MDEFNDIAKAFGEIDISKMSLSDQVECVKKIGELAKFMKEMVFKYGLDTPSSNTFLFKMGKEGEDNGRR